MLEKLYAVSYAEEVSYSEIFSRFDIEEEPFLHINLSLEDAIESLMRVSEDGYYDELYYIIREGSFHNLINDYETTRNGKDVKVFLWNEDTHSMEELTSI
jgi:hypothetical protein